ncbi:dioxygenase family protein [Ramlibacter montanisoli]|uniref:dioxygenase family protein n=1 Tax=Ramlibacter montanisoli TaxID=2732512 RepID=UPI0014914DE9|nr:protocatechuate 3,4-dioxygenase [Ramlibacter montanisoli]
MAHFSRRTAAAALVALPFCWTGARAQQAAARRATPRQTEGPFYPVTLPQDADADLLRNGQVNYAHGQPAWVEGVVSDLEGRPVAGAQVEIWQCDHQGRYHHPGDGGRADPDFQGFGRVTVGSDGRYRFRTIKPVPYSGRTPHIHVKVKLARRELLTTQLYVEGDPNNERDFLWRNLGTDRTLVTVPFRAGSDGLQASFPIVVAA